MTVYLTTAIDYVNNIPHIGTAYEKIGADVLARFARLNGESVRFQIGSDEHSVNVKKESENQGLEPKVYCDHMAKTFKAIWQKLDISYDHFIQTTDADHAKSVQLCFAEMLKNGDIYEGDYEGWYCESCEAFYMEKDLSEGNCPHHRKPPRWIKEKNLFFRLSRYESQLLAYIQTHPDFIRPKTRENEILELIKGGLQDISVSRSGVSWGIPLPSHPGHVVYVWFDALINYISGLRYHLQGKADDKTGDGACFATWWPASLHIIGKDITRFHCVIWPAMLFSLGLPLPKTVFGHGFVYLRGEKMSKSLGNFLTPLDVVDKWGADALRYYLLREGSFGRDGDFTWENFAARYQSDLANGIGNLLSRTVGMLGKYQSGRFVKREGAFVKTVRAEAVSTFHAVKRALDPSIDDDIDFHKALAAIWELIRLCDREIDHAAPWKLMKEGNVDAVAEVLSGVGEGLRAVAILLAPFIPSTARKVWQALGLDRDTPFDDWSRHGNGRLLLETGDIPDGTAAHVETPLFPRLEV